MHPGTIELMHEQVRTIYRAATGAELGEGEGDGPSTDEAAAASDEGDIERRFAELDALVRRIPALGERVPPFSFTPLADVIDDGEELIVEVAVPGVEQREDVTVVIADRRLTVSGLRRGERVSNGRSYVHAEIPRGPFERVIALPCAVEPRARIEIHGGVIVIRVNKATSEQGEAP